MQKTNFKTRLLALLTAVFMVVMCMPFAAFAASTDPAAREKIVVSFTKDNKTENVVLVKDSVSQNAPKVEGGKWVTDTKGAPELGSEAIMMWSEMDRWATGDWDNEAYISYTFKADEKEPEVKKTVNINLNTNNTKGVFVGYDGAETISFENLPENGDPIALPEVKANDGYKFTGWKVEGAGEAGHLDANATEFGYTGVAHFPKDSNVGYVTLTAQFEEVKTEQPEETKKTVSVTITTNNEQGIFPDYDGQEVIHFDNLDPNTDQQFELPKVEAKPGYEFIGWHVNGNEVGAWDADAKTFGITGLAHFEKGSNVGYLTIAAVYKAETERTVEVTFSVAPDKGEFKNKELYTKTADNAQKLTTTEFDGTQYAIPEVVAKEGYKFVGWKGQGADVIAWDAEAKTFGVTGLCFFNGDDATTGYATVEAVFEKVEDKKNDNSSSSSSSSSSSNKTTTASSKAEQKVVKAAAAPANTTKVLPKTGASNVAPLLGGSLAVVALLMGYGVYSLVLRKKD